MNFLFLMDELETVVRIKDTSYIFMLEAYRRRHNVYYVANENISFNEKQLSFLVQKVKPLTSKKTNPFTLIGQPTELNEPQVDAIFIRSEPPFNEQYLTNTWLLSLLNDKVFCINSPQGIREVNEKVWVTRFQDFTPKTIITQHKKYFENFLKAAKKNYS